MCLRQKKAAHDRARAPVVGDRGLSRTYADAWARYIAAPHAAPRKRAARRRVAIYQAFAATKCRARASNNGRNRTHR
jgi:hypothetical protein